MQRDQHTVKAFVTQHEDGKDTKRPQESAERGVVPDQRDVQTTTPKEYVTHVPHTVRVDFQVSERAALINHCSRNSKHHQSLTRL